MSAEQKFFWLIGGVTALLVIATLIGRALAARVNGELGRAVIVNLNARIRAWWVMVGIFAVAFLLGRAATLALFAIVSFCALREFFAWVPTHAGDRRARTLALWVLVPVQYWLIWIEWYGLFAVFIPVYGFLLLPTLAVLAHDPARFLERSAAIQWGTMIAIYCISHVPALLLLDLEGDAGQNALLMFFLLLVVQMSDVLQYVAGKLWGRTPVAPAVSPAKTVEGLVGGAAGATAIGAAMWWITPFTPLQAAGMALLVVAMGFIGGLVLSAVKRSLGAKDWGSMIRGHGGMLDRMDSVSFAAPVFFHLTRYYF